MDLSKIPNRVWWIITPTILMPTGFLILSVGYLLLIYSSILPKAKGLTIDTPYVKVVTEFADQQIAINNDLQKIILEASSSINNLLKDSEINYVASDKPEPLPIKVNSKELVSKLSSQSIFLEKKQHQLQKINKKLIEIKNSVKILNGE